MNGYIIQNREGRYLNKHRVWYEHGNAEDAFVYTTSEMVSIFEDCKAWDSKPYALIPARYSPDEGTVITGKPLSLTDAELRAAKSFAEHIGALLNKDQ